MSSDGNATAMSDPHKILSKIITPVLLTHAVRIEVPWPPDSTLDASEVAERFFNYDTGPAWSTQSIQNFLLALSKINLNDNRINLLSYLPPPSSSKFPEQALGLILLLDQAPRHLCKGVNIRYTYSHFAVFGRRLAEQILALPAQENLFQPAAWKKSGTTFENAIVRITMLLAPIVHSETLEDQRLQLSLTDKLRAEIEDVSGRRDPHRATLETDLHYIFGMANLLRQGPPRGQHATVAGFVYWMFRYFRFHVSFVRHFGRSPLRNIAFGRDSTAEELEWLKTCGWVEEGDGAVAKQIKRDIARGVWQPLELSQD